MAKYFTKNELQAVSFGLSSSDDVLNYVNPTSLARLDKAREIAGVPFHLTCAYRSPAWELSKGRSGRGAHTTGQAFDIACKHGPTRWKIIFGLLAAGFPRIGIASGYIHADDSNISQASIWIY